MPPAASVYSTGKPRTHETAWARGFGYSGQLLCACALHVQHVLAKLRAPEIGSSAPLSHQPRPHRTSRLAALRLRQQACLLHGVHRGQPWAPVCTTASGARKEGDLLVFRAPLEFRLKYLSQLAWAPL